MSLQRTKSHSKRKKHSSDSWDIEKGTVKAVSPYKIPVDTVKQMAAEIERSGRPLTRKQLDDFFKAGPPEQREMKGMADADIESYVAAVNEPVSFFKARGTKHTNKRRRTNKGRHRRHKKTHKRRHTNKRRYRRH